MGTYFLTEAEQHLRTHQFETGSGIRLASIQATLLLYERCLFPCPKIQLAPLITTMHGTNFFIIPGTP